MAVSPAAYPWSSYRTYIGRAFTPTWLHTATTLRIFGGDLDASREAYRQRKDEKGTDLFSVDALCPGTGSPEHTPVAVSVVALDSILAAVARWQHVPLADILQKGYKRNLARDVAICLAAELSGLPGVKLGKAFGGIKPPAVAMRCRAIRERIDVDAAFRRDVSAATPFCAILLRCVARFFIICKQFFRTTKRFLLVLGSPCPARRRTYVHRVHRAIMNV